MDFSLSLEQEAVQNRARQVAQEVKAQAGQIYAGTNAIMRLIIARDLLRGE